jgi:pimeloyl-ACP methyl ester carboxylesterase
MPIQQLIPILTVILIIVFVVVRFKLHVHMRKGLPGFIHALGLIVRRLPAGLTDARIQLQDSEVAFLSGGSGQDVVFLHDFGGEKDDWVPVAGKFRGYKRWIPDLPGFGESPPSHNHRYDTVSQVRRLGSFLQRNSVQRCHLVGVGMSGAIAGIYTSVNAKQVITLTLIEPMGIDAKLKTDIEGLTARGWSPLTAGNDREWERLLKTLFVKPPSFGLGRRRHLQEQAAKYKAEHDRIWKEIHKDRPYLLEQILPEVKVPTLVITGDSAKIFHPSAVKHLEEALPDATVKVLKGVGHWPMAERPKEVAKVILEFIKPRS